MPTSRKTGGTNPPARCTTGKAADRFRVNIREARTSDGISQVDAARRAEIPQSLWSEIETGDAMPGLNNAERMAQALGHTLAEML
jgi:transcriptional regulator with XRE-family HTH domain